MATYLVRKGVGSNPTSVIPSFFFRSSVPNIYMAAGSEHFLKSVSRL